MYICVWIEVNLWMEILGVMWMKNKFYIREIWKYEIIERVNVLAPLKPKGFVCQQTMVVDQTCNQEFFRTE